MIGNDIPAVLVVGPGRREGLEVEVEMENEVLSRAYPVLGDGPSATYSLEVLAGYGRWNPTPRFGCFVLIGFTSGRPESVFEEGESCQVFPQAAGGLLRETFGGLRISMLSDWIWDVTTDGCVLGFLVIYFVKFLLCLEANSCGSLSWAMSTPGTGHRAVTYSKQSKKWVCSVY